MAYDKEKLYEQALAEIKKYNLFFVEDVVALLPITSETFYKWWPLNSEKSDTIKNLLHENKIRTKSEIRSKLFKGKGMELIALYKLLATQDELRALNGQYLQHDNAPKIIMKFEDEEKMQKQKDFVNYIQKDFDKEK